MLPRRSTPRAPATATRRYALARSAYLDHFELAEVPLRLRDPNLTLDVEFQFATLRNDIRGGEPIGTLEADVRDHPGRPRRRRAGAVERRASAAPLLAFGYSFSILFREGVEAVLLIAILLGSLDAGRAKGYRRPLTLGRRRGAVRDGPDVGPRDAS